MKIDFRKYLEFEARGLYVIEHLVLQCLSQVDIDEVVQKSNYKETGELDLGFTINGVEVDVEPFLNTGKSALGNALKR